MNKKIISLACIGFLFVLIVGCAQLNEPVNDLEQSYTEAVKKYKKYKPRLDRDFQLLFGTKNGKIDTNAVKIKNYPDSGTPGIQDIVFSQFESYSDTKKQILIKANKRAISVFEEYKKIVGNMESSGIKVGNTLDTLDSITDKNKKGKIGLKILKEFIKVAGKAYIN
jgi:hypothetical protein